MTQSFMSIVVQEWEESERGWGTSFDGYSLHATSEDRDEYIQEYWGSMPDGPAPDIYSRPVGNPRISILSHDLTEAVIHSKNGIRTYERVFGE